jgi:hypothetical protein
MNNQNGPIGSTTPRNQKPSACPVHRFVRASAGAAWRIEGLPKLGLEVSPVLRAEAIAWHGIDTDPDVLVWAFALPARTPVVTVYSRSHLARLPNIDCAPRTVLGHAQNDVNCGGVREVRFSKAHTRELGSGNRHRRRSRSHVFAL